MGEGRFETIEINLKPNRVEQCREIHNSNSKYHDRIIELVNKNIKHVRTKQIA